MYDIKYKPEYIKRLAKLEIKIQIRSKKVTDKLKQAKKRRHLKKGNPYFVENLGQYRILYKLYEDEKIIELLFIGTHKEYEKYYKQLF
jgi:mRNA-degrading endonuclease RelE of RelBE toxin-antitoxin system